MFLPTLCERSLLFFSLGSALDQKRLPNPNEHCQVRVRSVFSLLFVEIDQPMPRQRRSIIKAPMQTSSEKGIHPWICYLNKRSISRSPRPSLSLSWYLLVHRARTSPCTDREYCRQYMSLNMKLITQKGNMKGQRLIETSGPVHLSSIGTSNWSAKKSSNRRDEEVFDYIRLITRTISFVLVHICLLVDARGWINIALSIEFPIQSWDSLLDKRLGKVISFSVASATFLRINAKNHPFCVLLNRAKVASVLAFGHHFVQSGEMHTQLSEQIE